MALACFVCLTKTLRTSCQLNLRLLYDLLCRLRALVKALWVETLSQGSPKTSENTYTYIMIHNSSKISYEVATIVLWLGITTHEELC